MVIFTGILSVSLFLTGQGQELRNDHLGLRAIAVKPSGVRLIQVAPESIGSQAGLLPADIIKSYIRGRVDGEGSTPPVAVSAENFARIGSTDYPPGTIWRLRVHRPSRNTVVFVEIVR